MRWLLPFCLIASACGGGPKIDGRDASQIERQYEDAYDRWTRSGHAYEYFEGRAFVYATYWSPDFVDALARYESVRSGHLAKEATENAAKRKAEAAGKRRFLVTLITQNLFWNDLDRKDPSFTLRLIQGDQAIEPIKVTAVRRDQTEDLAHFYGHVDPLGTAYWVEFPEGPLTVMRVAGPPAKIDLNWVAD